MHHYVYRITHIKNKMHYYGSRSCPDEPKNDLGIMYFSSSKILSTEIKNGDKKDYRFKVVKVFETRHEAYSYESKLHKKFSVNTNENFYNKSIQLTSKFSWAGSTHTEETKQKMSSDRKGRVPWNAGIKLSDIYTKEERKEKYTSKHSGWKKINNEYWSKPENRARRNTSLSEMNRGEGNPFFGKSHKEETKKVLSNIRKQPITVVFDNGNRANFDEYKDLGIYLGKSGHLGAKLCKPQYEYLLKNYGIKEIIKNEKTQNI